MAKYELAIVDPENHPIGTLVLKAASRELARLKGEKQLPAWAAVANVRVYREPPKEEDLPKPW